MVLKEPSTQYEITLELHVPNFEIALNFYQILGFTLTRRLEKYMVLIRGKQTLCFYGGSPSVSEHSYFGQYPPDTKRGYGVEIVLFQENISEFYARLQNVLKVVAPLQLRPWGRWDFRIEDPFGFYIRISEPYDIRCAENGV